jgi:integrase
LGSHIENFPPVKSAYPIFQLTRQQINKSLPVHFYSIRHDIKGITDFQGIIGKIGIDILQSFKLYIFNTLQAKDFHMPSKKSPARIQITHPRAVRSVLIPIKKLKDIKAIKKLLHDQPRNLCLFTMGINTNLRASDLLRITAGMVRHLEAGDELTLKEKKTGKHRRITLNKAVIASIQALLDSRDYQDDDPLFLGQRGCLTFLKCQSACQNVVC